MEKGSCIAVLARYMKLVRLLSLDKVLDIPVNDIHIY